MSWQLNPKLQLILTPENWKLIQDVNTLVNSSVKYKTDMELYNKPDFWTIADKYGDCDDYACTKRHLLIQKGIPKACLRFAVCMVGPEYHAVLLIETDRGTYTLDNRVPNVIYYKDLPYKWLMLQRQNDTWWEKITG